MYSTVFKTGEVYFDSMVAIIFLLNAGRLVQKKAVEKIENKLSSSKLMGSDFCKLVKEDDSISFERATNIKKGDTIRVSTGDVIPVASNCYLLVQR